MNIKPEALGTRLDRPSPDVRCYLLHGPDEAGAAELARRLARAMGPDAERVDLDATTLKGRPGTLADEAASLSLFGGARHIRVTGGEDLLPSVELLLAAEQAGNPVVILAPTVKRTGKLVKLVAAARGALECACYPPDAAGAARLAAQLGRDAGLRIAPDVADALGRASAGDRAILAREVEKLALYLDAAPDRPRDADMASLDAIGAALDDSEATNAVAAIVGGDPALAGAEISALAEGGNHSIPLLRALARRLLALAEMRGEIDAGDPADGVMERHRVFWKEKDATRVALRRWDAATLARALQRVRATERAVMRGGSAGDLLTAQLGLTLARAAARVR